MNEQLTFSFSQIEDEIFNEWDSKWITPIEKKRYRITRAWIEHWNKYSGDLCREGDYVCRVIFKTELGNYQKNCFAHSEGIIITTLPRHGLYPEKDFQDGQLIFSIDESEEAREKVQQKIEPQLKSICYLYLMHDTTNGFYKIGISNNPEYRERTLQSEKPTIELLASKSYSTRELAKSFENALHNTYSNKRLRGEWFHLDEQDVENLRKLLE